MPVSRSKQISWTVAGILIGLIVGGYPLILGLRAPEMDWVLPLDAIPGIICIALIVPLVLPALAMRGGTLMYVWAYIAASQFFYMAYDIWRGSWPALGWSMSPGRNVEEIIRALALMSYCCAAIAQRRATDQARA